MRFTRNSIAHPSTCYGQSRISEGEGSTCLYRLCWLRMSTLPDRSDAYVYTPLRYMHHYVTVGWWALTSIRTTVVTVLLLSLCKYYPRACGVSYTVKKNYVYRIPGERKVRRDYKSVPSRRSEHHILYLVYKSDLYHMPQSGR